MYGTQHTTHSTTVARFALPLSLLVLAVSLRLAPVSPTYLAWSVLIGVLYTLGIEVYRRYYAHTWSWLLLILTIAVMLQGMHWARDLSWSLPMQRTFRWWFLHQSLSIVLTVFFGSILARTPAFRRAYVGGGMLLTTMLTLWIGYCWQQSRLLLPANVAMVVVDDDAPPGVRKITFVTPDPAVNVLDFYRQSLPQRGWAYSCALQTRSCLSNIRVADDALHDIYHRQGTDQRGPSFEVRVEPIGTTTHVTVYDQTRGAPPPLSSHLP